MTSSRQGDLLRKQRSLFSVLPVLVTFAALLAGGAVFLAGLAYAGDPPTPAPPQEGAADAKGPELKQPHIVARLLADRASVRPGEALHVGVEFQMEEHWHVYWQQPGDAGLEPKLSWDLPAGFRMGALRWPTPRRHVNGPLVGYIYEGDVLLSIPVQVPFDLVASSVTLAVDVEWLVCEDDRGCIPGEGRLTLTLPVTTEKSAASFSAPVFEAADQQLPQRATPSMVTELGGASATVTLTGPGPWADKDARFELLWRTWDLFDPLESPYVDRSDGRITLASDFLESGVGPTTFGALLIVTTAAKRQAYELTWQVPLESVPAAAPAALPTPVDASRESKDKLAAETSSPASPREADDLRWADQYVEFDGAGASSGVDERSFWSALLLALLGGLLLNLMPCVLPVLSLKILGFVDQASQDPRRTRHLGYAFAGGVVGSFLLIAGLLIGLRDAGDQVGWGFQLQEPVVVVSLALLMFTLGLNFLGVFEIGGGMTGLAGRAAQRVENKGVLGSVCSGALATVIATPCTAPFMGPAIGYALTQPAFAALAVFASIGLGMCAPYVLLSVFPRWLRFLPKPGPWMVRLKEVMAFPMFATVIWLVWVFGRQVGTDGVVALLVACLLLGLGAWLYGTYGTALSRPRTRWLVGRACALALVVIGVWFAVTRADVDSSSGAQLVATAADGWVSYDGHQIRAAQEAGRPVFLDFTADWCLTCKANEATFLETDAMRAAVEAHGAVLMQADWTRRDARITEALARLGRSSVPLYVIVPADPARPAVVLRTAITTSYVVSALDRVLAPTAD